MTECNGLPLVFSSLGRKKIQVDFTGGRLASDAEAALLRKVDRRIGLIEALADCIGDPRQPAKITHNLLTMLAQRILAMAMDYENINDHDSLGIDPLLQIITERGVDEKQPLASAGITAKNQQER